MKRLLIFISALIVGLILTKKKSKKEETLFI